MASTRHDDHEHADDLEEQHHSHADPSHAGHAHDHGKHDDLEHDHDHGEHDHEHDHAHDEHDHEHAHGPLGWLQELLPFGHGHSHSELNVDDALESSNRGIRAVQISLVGLGATALLQLLAVLVSGSVALLADTIHNFSDALTAIPLWIAFSLSNRPPTRRYTYGFGRAEDVAGILIVLLIFASSILAVVTSIEKIVHRSSVHNLGVVALAAIIGFIGNEAVASYRIRVGNEIGSAALVADGMHARTDGLTSLAVLLGVFGVLLGFPLADPILGILISIAILVIVRDTALAMWYRLMDAVDPAFVDRVETAATTVPGVQAVTEVRVRWMGHRLAAELHILVDEDLSTRESHAIIEEVRHTLFHTLSKLSAVIVHADPCGHSGQPHHALTEHHSAR
jgi:cation diffusion facilitator family transporter